MSVLVIAEKPSVARDIARVLGAAGRREGWLEGNGYRVAWALGHLVRLAEPDEYGGPWAGRWSLAQLPMIPERWEQRVETRTRDQFAIIKKLLRDPETKRIVCATDAGREGEHIFRLIHEASGCRQPFERLWISSLTDEAIRAGFAALRPGRDFDDLAAAARARSRADWLVGMNLTRAYTVHNRVLCTIGRVQTPTLAMIVERDRRIAGFVKTFFYELVASFAEGFEARYVEDGETRIERRETAERLHRELSPHRTGTVLRVETQVKRQRPPPLHDLTTLQRDANRRFGSTAAQVLEQAQALYETHKLISYPRTESRHLSEDMLPKLPGILANLEHPLAGEALGRLEAGHRLGKAYVDRNRLTDHHAIIPTGRRPPASLPAPLRQLFELVAARFVAIFLPERTVEETEVEVRIGDASFIARASRELDPGWKRVEPRRAEADAEADANETSRLPPLAPGQIVQVTDLRIDEKETQPPRPYDDASLLAAMKNAGREIDDEALAAVMKDSGLGTPATRAEIIEKLIRSGYLERQRKQLRATPKGQALIGIVAPPLRSPELTAAWEQQLREVERGERRAADFEAAIAGFVRELIPEIARGPALSPEQAAAARAAKAATAPAGRPGAASEAGKGVAPARAARARQAETSTAERKGVTSEAGKGAAPARAARARQTETSTAERKGVTSEAGKGAATAPAGRPGAASATRKGSAAAARTGRGARSAAAEAADANTRNRARSSGSAAAPPPGSPAAPSIRERPPVCPKCGQGRIIEGRRGYGCNRYREGCDFVVWKSIGGLTLDESGIRTLIEERQLGPLSGLLDDAGQPMTAAWLGLGADWQVRIERRDPRD